MRGPGPRSIGIIALSWLSLVACGAEVGGGPTGSAGSGAQTGNGGSGTAGANGGAGIGTAGTTGTGGATGTAGTTGTAGSTGTAGTIGSAGSVGGLASLIGKKALYLVDDPSSLDNGDVILQMSLQVWGMTVTFGAATGPASLANGQNVVIVSSGAGAGDFVPTFKDVAVPMIVFGNSAYQTLGWTAGSSGKGSVASTTPVTLVEVGTPLVSDLMTGVGFKMILDSRSTSLYWGTPAGAPIRVASVMGASTQLAVFAFEKGSMTAAGTAAARRVGFGVKTDSIQSLTIEGFKLLSAAIVWTAGSG
jgi:hypothetical protein